MTFPSSGTSNAVQAALGISAAGVTTALTTSPLACPLVLQHSSQEGFWQDPGLLNLQNVIWQETNLVYRM